MKSQPSILRDFTVDRRVWLLSAVALVVGTGGAALAVLLLRGIGLATNLFYYHRLARSWCLPLEARSASGCHWYLFWAD